MRLDLTYAFSARRLPGAGLGTGHRTWAPTAGRCWSAWARRSANTEANVEENHRDLALVTKRDETERTNLGSLEPGERRALSGPFDWVALKSKYFVTGLIAADTTGGRISGATMDAAPGSGEPTSGADPASACRSRRAARSSYSCTPARWSTTGWPGWVTTSTT